MDDVAKVVADIEAEQAAASKDVLPDLMPDGAYTIAGYVAQRLSVSHKILLGKVKEFDKDISEYELLQVGMFALFGSNPVALWKLARHPQKLLEAGIDWCSTIAPEAGEQMMEWVADELNRASKADKLLAANSGESAGGEDGGNPTIGQPH